MVIEIDGSQHFSRKGKKTDSERDQYLKGLGFKVLRFNNAEVTTNIAEVVEEIRRNL